MNEIANIDEVVLKLLHYFIADKGYSPIVLHGAQNEIWLEKMSGDYKIIRIVMTSISAMGIRSFVPASSPYFLARRFRSAKASCAS